jgi:protein-tyrosine phosphatase
MKLLFVCLGNICRSPLAKIIMDEKITKYKLDAETDSAGFERFHRGDPADARSVNVARAHNLDLTSHRARMFIPRDFDEFDRIFVMDRTNYNDVMGVARDSNDESKVDYILNAIYPGEDRHVPDPWYGGKEGFEKVFQLLDLACESLAMNTSSNRQIDKSLNQPIDQSPNQL